MPEAKTANNGGGLKNWPWVTISIIVVNTVVAVVTRLDPEYYRYVYARTYGLLPSELRPGSLLTSAFLHDGCVHLAINMSLLYVFGSKVEKVMGGLEYVLFYLGSCFAASLAHVAIVYASLPDYYAGQVVVGASGAVAAVMGFYAVRFHRSVFRFAGADVPALLVIMMWLVLQLLLGILGLYRESILGIGLRQVGYWSHLGGFGFGVAVALLANMAVEGEREHLLQQAVENRNAGNLLEAVQQLETVLKYVPADADSHAELARLWALLHERDESLRCFNCAIQLYLSQGREKMAIAAAEDMERFWPGCNLDSTDSFRLATYLEEAGQTERAVQMLDEIAAANPDTEEAEMALFKAGQLRLSALGNSAQAAASLREFLRRYPGSEWAEFAREFLNKAEDAA